MTILGSEFAEVCRIPVSKIQDGSEEKMRPKIEHTICQTSSCSPINALVFVSCCSRQPLIIAGEDRLYRTSSQTEDLPLYLRDYDSQRVIAQETKWSFVGRKEAFLEKPFMVGSGVRAFQCWDAKAFYDCGRYLPIVVCRTVNCSIWRVLSSFWCRGRWDRGWTESCYWQKSCLEKPGPLNRA